MNLTRRHVLQSSTALLLPAALQSQATAAAPTDFFSSSEKPSDGRLSALRNLNTYVPFQVPKTLEEWEARRKKLREQLLVANGLLPMPPKFPLKPTIHGKSVKDGYSIEKVSFASMPGHYVTGNLYRPLKTEGKSPAILFAHGHWNGGRFEVATEQQAERDLKSKAEGTPESARYFMQALPVTLAKLGFVVFQYDMVGYADSLAIMHREGFTDVQAELRLQSFMGLQTWNSLRAFDFVFGLPDVDNKKIGMTGASGGGTQTFVLAGIENRLAAAFPAVMVSTEMQGGCVCENCSLLRTGTVNVEIAALFAPKPMAMSCANDWTKNFLKEGYGLPELKKLYTMYGKPENVDGKLWIEYPHNYNQPAREFMYSWFSKHLLGKEGPVSEPKFEPEVPPKKLSVYDETHPRPKDEATAADLKKNMTEYSDAMLKLMPTKSLQPILQRAIRVMIQDELPTEIAIRKGPLESKHDGVTMHRALLGRKNESDAVPFAGVYGAKFSTKKALLWVHPQGKASLFDGEKLSAGVQTAVDAGFAVIAMDPFGIGELGAGKVDVDKKYAGFTFGYNRARLAQQAHDILTGIAFAKQIGKFEHVVLVGWEKMGPAVALAAAVAGNSVNRMAVELAGFDFDQVTSTADPMMLTGALKYGGIDGILSACAPMTLQIQGPKAELKMTKRAYTQTNAKDNLMVAKITTLADTVQWLIS